MRANVSLSARSQTKAGGGKHAVLFRRLKCNVTAELDHCQVEMEHHTILMRPSALQEAPCERRHVSTATDVYRNLDGMSMPVLVVVD